MHCIPDESQHLKYGDESQHPELQNDSERFKTIHNDRTAIDEAAGSAEEIEKACAEAADAAEAPMLFCIYCRLDS